jgi:hypothetical protein
MTAKPPPEFCCPITNELMTDPVIMRDGHTYERSALAEWLSRHPTSPITREPMQMSDARPNRALKNLIDNYQEERRRPSPPRWTPTHPVVLHKVTILGRLRPARPHHQPEVDEQIRGRV